MSAEVLSSSRGQAMFSGQCRVHNWRTVIEAVIPCQTRVMSSGVNMDTEVNRPQNVGLPPTPSVNMLGSLTMVNHIAPPHTQCQSPTWSLTNLVGL